MERSPISIGQALLILLILIYVWAVGMIHLYKEFQTEVKGLFYNYSEKVYIPAVVNEIKGILTTFYLKVSEGTGKVYIGMPPVMDNYALVGMLFAKQAVCKIFPSCNKYDYYITTDGISYGKGSSESAGIFLMMYTFLAHKKLNVVYPITGFMLPNGVIGQVGGIDAKLNATLREGFKYLVAPAEGRNILPAYTFLDLIRIYFGEKIKINKNLPEGQEYKEIIRKIAYEMCKGIDDKNITKYLNLGRYYTAASLCYIEKSKNWKVNYTNNEISKMIKDFEYKIEKQRCWTYECKEIKYQILKRLEMAAKMNNTTEKYWRYVTAVGWSNFLKITNAINRVDTCNKVLEDFRYVRLLYETSGRYIPNVENCFDARENMTLLLLPFVNVNENNFKDIENLVYYYLEKNGFSITAYSYLQYAKYWAEQKNWNNARYYLLLALDYAI